MNIDEMKVSELKEYAINLQKENTELKEKLSNSLFKESTILSLVHIISSGKKPMDIIREVIRIES